MTGLYAQLNNSGSVAIYNQTTDEEAYILPAPIMYDALGNVSEDVNYTLTGNGNSYTLTMEADADWINEADRSMPVTLNATYSDSSDIVYDTFVKGTEPDTPLGDRMSLWVRSNMVTYIYSPTITLPLGAVFDKAYLNTNYYFYDYVNEGSVIVFARRVNYGMWSEDTLTYNSVVGQANFGCAAAKLDTQEAFATTTAKYSTPQPLSFEITEAARGWLNGTYPNYGISLQYDLHSVNLSMPFRSSESGITYGPRIVYRYKIPHVNLELKYDGGYATRHSAPATRISTIAEEVQDFYWEEFGIEVNWTYPNDFCSYADECKSPYNAYCSCYTGCENSTADALMTTHHKNITNILYRLPVSTDESSITMAFSGHVTCIAAAGNNCIHDYAFGVADEEFRAALITDSSGADHEIVTAIHELGHILGADDHYNTEYPNGGNQTDGYNDCIFGYNKENSEIISNQTICQVCRNKIMEKRAQFCS